MQVDTSQSSWRALGNFINNVTLAPRLFYENPTVAWQALQQLLSGCNGGNVSYAGTGAATLLRIPYVGTILGLSLATVAGILGISALAGTLRQREAIPELQDEDRIRMQQEGEQQSNPEQFPFVNPQLTPQPTATQQRANMRVQLQRGSTDHYASIELFDITGTGGGVTTNQIIDALRQLRQNPAITRKENQKADDALRRAINWTQARPPTGVSQQGYSWEFYFNLQN